MRHPLLPIPSLSLVLLAGLSVLHADGFRNPPVGADGQARFGGNIANTPDAAAVSLNPANLIEFTDRAYLATVTLGSSSMDFSSPAGFTVSSDSPWAVLPGLFMVLPPEEGERWAFGLGVTSPYGRSTRLPDDNPLVYAAPYFTELRSLQFSPAFSTRLSEKVTFGFSVHLVYSELDLRQKYPWALAAGVPGLPDGRTRFEANGSGIGASVALTVQATERQRVAFTLRSPVKVDYRGTLEVSEIPPGAPGAPVSDFETEITFPLVAAAAYSLRVTDRLLLETNFEWIQHSEFDRLDLDAGVNTPLLPSASIPADWEDNYTLGISAAYTLNTEWELRAGYIFLESPVPSRTMLPTTSEQDQGVVAIGAGYTPGERHRFDFAYSYGLFSGRTVNDNLNPAFNGDYDFEAHLITLNYGYRF